MRVLVAHGSRMLGTTGIAQLVGAALTDSGFQVDVAMELLSLDRPGQLHA